jgi:hypothetical protein
MTENWCFLDKNRVALTLVMSDARCNLLFLSDIGDDTGIIRRPGDPAASLDLRPNDNSFRSEVAGKTARLRVSGFLFDESERLTWMDLLRSVIECRDR